MVSKIDNCSGDSTLLMTCWEEGHNYSELRKFFDFYFSRHGVRIDFMSKKTIEYDSSINYIKPDFLVADLFSLRQLMNQILSANISALHWFAANVNNRYLYISTFSCSMIDPFMLNLSRFLNMRCLYFPHGLPQKCLPSDDFDFVGIDKGQYLESLL